MRTRLAWIGLVGAMDLTRAVLPGSSARHHHPRHRSRLPARPTLRRPCPAHSGSWRRRILLKVVTVPAVRQLFDTGLVYEPISARQAPSTLVPVIPTMDFHSEALLAATVTARTFPRDIRAVIYDNERFPNTPGWSRSASSNIRPRTLRWRRRTTCKASATLSNPTACR
jgi:hypothetical protein